MRLLTLALLFGIALMAGCEKNESPPTPKPIPRLNTEVVSPPKVETIPKIDLATLLEVSYDFRNVRWGYSRATVKAREKGLTLLSETKDAMKFITDLSGNRVSLTYMFDYVGQLDSAYYKLAGETIDVVNQLKEKAVMAYGQPRRVYVEEKDVDVWQTSRSLIFWEMYQSTPTLTIGILTYSAADEIADFRYFRWGQTLEEVMLREDAELESDSGPDSLRNLKYASTLNGIPIRIIYTFFQLDDENVPSLSFANLSFPFNEGDDIEDFKKYGLELYGEPTPADSPDIVHKDSLMEWHRNRDSIALFLDSDLGEVSFHHSGGSIAALRQMNRDLTNQR